MRLRNVAKDTAVRAKNLKVLVRTRFRTHLLLDNARQHRELKAAVSAFDLGPADPDVQALVPVVTHVLGGAYPQARKALDAADLAPDVVKEFRSIVNAELLPSRQLLWTIHGPCRSFRFWSPEEQEAYVRFAAEVVEALRDLTPHTCFGFGSVLSVVRDQALIPHDDDLDLIVGFEPHEAATLADGLALVSAHLEARGFSVRGTWSAHRQIGRGGRGKHVDVFVGLFEGDAISWYPGTRGALDRSTMYPPSSAPLLGVDCLIPAQPEVYLERLYGAGGARPTPTSRTGGTARPTPTSLVVRPARRPTRPPAPPDPDAGEADTRRRLSPRWPPRGRPAARRRGRRRTRPPRPAPRRTRRRGRRGCPRPTRCRPRGARGRG